MERVKEYLQKVILSLEIIQPLIQVTLTEEQKEILNTTRDTEYIRGKSDVIAKITMEELYNSIELSYNLGILRMFDVMSNMTQEEIDLIKNSAIKKVKQTLKQ